MVAVIKSCTLVGIDAAPVDVECEIARGLPGYHVVGLADTAVKEGSVRIRAALGSVGHELPLKKITINLAPADLRKPGSALDLPIAAAVLLADDTYPRGLLDGVLVLGELGLDGADAVGARCARCGDAREAARHARRGRAGDVRGRGGARRRPRGLRGSHIWRS